MLNPWQHQHSDRSGIVNLRCILQTRPRREFGTGKFWLKINGLWMA
jgi:hypothetical protein